MHFRLHSLVQLAKVVLLGQVSQVNLFWIKVPEPQLLAGKDRSINPDKSCNYCKDMGHDARKLPSLAKVKGTSWLIKIIQGRG